MKRALAVMIALLLVSASTVLVSAMTGSSSPSRLGVFRGSGQAGLVDGYEDWLGTSVGHAVDFVGGASASAEDPWAKIDDPSWWCRQWAERPWRLVLSTAILPTSSFTLAAGARGSYDAHWRSFGQRLVAGGCSDAILRLGWEFNGRFYPWAAGGQEAQFAAYWRRIVTVLRSVDGQGFLFDWCPLAGNTNADVEAAYPGDGYVDIIGLDAYDGSTVSASNPSARWANQVERQYGLNWQVNFARAHGKRMSFPEWGLTVRPNDDLGGGDNVAYITKMWQWMNEKNYLYAAYFEVDARDASHRLMTTQFPNSSAEYRRLVRGGSTTTTTTASGGTTTTTTRPPSSTTTSTSTTTTTAPPGDPSDPDYPGEDYLPDYTLLKDWSLATGHDVTHLVDDAAPTVEQQLRTFLSPSTTVTSPLTTPTTTPSLLTTPTTIKLPFPTSTTITSPLTTPTTVKSPVTTPTTIKLPVTTSTIKLPVTTTTIKLPVTTTTIKLPVTTTTIKLPVATTTTTIKLPVTTTTTVKLPVATTTTTITVPVITTTTITLPLCDIPLVC